MNIIELLQEIVDANIKSNVELKSIQLETDLFNKGISVVYFASNENGIVFRIKESDYSFIDGTILNTGKIIIK